MTLILEYRDKLKKFYRLNAVVILPILKFMLAFFALNGVNTMMGYMPKLDNIAIVLISSLACSFLPAGCLVLLCTLFSLGHMYALSIEALLISVCVYLLLFLLLLRFAPRDSYVVILTPLLFALKMPYVIPIAVGLLGSPLSAISVACGVLVYYFLNTMVGSASTLSAMGEKEYLDKIRYLIDAIMKNKPALVVAGAFAITVIVVYLLRRLSVEHAWTIAIVAGAMINLVLLLVGDLLYDINLSMGSAIIGSVLAVAVAKVIEFFRFCVDYGRTEWVQFEDDDYYYYVKAVPKMNIAASTKTVKRINTNTQSIATVGERTKGAGDGMKVVATQKQSVPVSRKNEVDGETRAMTPVMNGRLSNADGRGRVPLTEEERGSDRARYSRPGSGMTSGGNSYGARGASQRNFRGEDGDAHRQGSYAGKGIIAKNDQALNDDESDDYEELF